MKVEKRPKGAAPLSLVTGGTGFVGSAVVRRLIQAGHRVRVLVRPTSDLRNLYGLSLQRVKGDLRDSGSVRQAVEGCDFLFHVAADYRLWAPRPQEMYDSNVRGTEVLMQEALRAGIQKIVYTSSVATLKLNANGGTTDETGAASLTDMIGHYKRSKFLAERSVLRLVKTRQLPAVVVNPSTPVGPGDIRPTPTGRFIADAVAGRVPAYVNTGLNVVHVRDVATGHLLALKRGTIGERYILGGTNMTLKEILTEVTTMAGHPPPRICLPCHVIMPIAILSEIWARCASKKEPRVTVVGTKMAKTPMFFSSSKATRELGYRFRPAREALYDAVAWFHPNGNGQTRGQRKKRVFDHRIDRF